MSIYYTDDKVVLHHGDCLDVLATLPDASVDAVVTDPPYGLANTDPRHVEETFRRWVNGERDYLPGGRGFMGKEWDAFVPPVAVWDECLRVLKPGGHVLAFAGSRTVDLMTLGLRLAGFDIRDSLAWLYGSGFPKSMDVSKAIDKNNAVNHARQLEFTAWMRSTGITARQIDEATGTQMGSRYLTGGTKPSIATQDLFNKLRPHLPVVPEHIERLVAERTGIEWTDYAKRQVTQEAARENAPGTAISFDQRSSTERERRDIAATDAAREWEGWGTALKPAFEPIVMARKPLTGTVAANVLEHGTGALNIDACRVATSDSLGGGRISTRSDGWDRPWKHNPEAIAAAHERGAASVAKAEALGRWPANVILDESQAEALDEQAPATGGSGKASGPSLTGATAASVAYGARNGLAGEPAFYGDKGGASRFFYVAKAPKSERPVVDGVAHPTVKPISLMSWLVRLVTPPGGTVLEPFAGSGTTVEAAMREGFNVVAVEREADYLPLIMARIDRENARQAAEDANRTPSLFDEEAS